MIREEWIRAKYERKEFVKSPPSVYTAGRKEGILMKRGKDKKNFQRRKFVLDATENTLKYYNKEEVSWFYIIPYFLIVPEMYLK